MRTLTIKKVGNMFEVDDAAVPGSPPIGRGQSMDAAIGNWLRNNQQELGIEFKLDGSAKKTEEARRKRELAKR